MTSRISRSYASLTTSNSLAPFLYQTRTLTVPLRYPYQPRSPYSTSNAAREEIGQDGTSDPAQNKSDLLTDDGNNTAPKPRTSYLRKRASLAPRQELPKQPDKSLRTMTNDEKKTFGNLLEQLSTMRKEQKKGGEPETTKGKSNSQELITDVDQHEMAQISDIFDAVLKDIRRKRPNLDKLGPTGSEVDSGRQLAKSRGANIDIAELNDGNVSTREAAKLVMRRESAKIEAALRDAITDGRGDMGVWEVCKARIFSMLQYLGEAQGLDPKYLPPPGMLMPALPSGEKPANDLSGSDETKSAEEDKVPEKEQSALVTTQREMGVEAPDNDQTESSESEPKAVIGPLEIPSFVPVENVVSLLYPRMLLVAFRLINTHFPNSPLISQFRSTIKAHGRVSMVLGSSTGLFNELLYFHWRGCNDLPGVISLLQEMETTGAEPNERTHSLLHSIIAQRNRDLKDYHTRRNAGDAVPKDPWWDMAPNRKAMREIMGRDGWARKIYLRAEQAKKQDMDRSVERKKKKQYRKDGYRMERA